MICPRCGEANPERARFCLNCGAALESPSRPRPEVRKIVTVVFADITGSTELGERVDPESLRRVLARYFDRMRVVLTRHGGTVEKFIGDAVMAVFGIPELHEDDALRAVRASLEMRDALAELNHELDQAWGVQLRVHIGVNTGEVVAGDPSVAQTLVTGDAVNVAARLEQVASPCEILLGPITYRMVRDAVRVEQLDPVVLKGKAKALDAYRLLEVRAGALGHARNPTAPLVGREQERRLVSWAFQRTLRERTCHLFTVLGPAGAGKSRLVADAASGFSSEALVIGGECPPYGEGVAFWPLAQAVRQALHADATAEVEQTRASLDAILGDREDAPLVAGRLNAMLHGDSAEVSVDDLAWAVRKLLEALAQTKPLVVVFDDLHWAESTFLDLIDHVTDWSRGVPILLLCAARPELLENRASWGGGKLNATSIHLEPLTEPESAELLGNLLSQGELADDVRAWITEAAEGNPLFVEEMLAMLLDEGLLWWDGVQWVPTVDIRKLAMPPTIQALLASRLDRLSPTLAAVLQRASVVGKVFDVAAVAALSPDTGDVTSALMGLARKDVIRPEGSGPRGEAFRFRHLLIRDAAYESLPKAERADLHERLAGWYAGLEGDHSDLDELVGYHLESAHDYLVALGPEDERSRGLASRAAAPLAAAGERALGRDDLAAARNLLARACALARSDDPRHAQMLLAYGTALLGLGDLAAADDVFCRALDAAELAGDDRLHAHGRLARLEVRLHTDPTAALDVARTEVPPIIDLLESLDDHRGLSRAWSLMGSIFWTRGFVARSEDAAQRALAHARNAGDSTADAQILAVLLACAMYGPRPVEDGIRSTEQMLAEVEGNQSLRARALRALGLMRAMQGRFDEARRLVAETRRICEDLGQVLFVAGADQVLGLIELMAEDYEAAGQAFQRSTEVLVQRGDRSYMSTSAALLAHARHALGDLDEAERMTRIAEENAAEADIDTQTIWRAARAKVRSDQGRLDEAVALALEALAIGRETDLSTYADNLVDIAEVLARAGRNDEARRALDDALDRYASKGNVACAAAARRRLSGLGSTANLAG